MKGPGKAPTRRGDRRREAAPLADEVKAGQVDGGFADGLPDRECRPDSLVHPGVNILEIPGISADQCRGEEVFFNVATTVSGVS